MKLYELIDRQLNRLLQKFPQEQVVSPFFFLFNGPNYSITFRPTLFFLAAWEIQCTSSTASGNATPLATLLSQIPDISESV